MRSASRTNLWRASLAVLALAVFAAVAVRFARRSPSAAIALPGSDSALHASAAPSAPAAAIDSPTSNALASVQASVAPQQTRLSAIAVPSAAKPSIPTSPVAPPGETAMIEIDKVNLMIRDYRTIAGENPVGTNAEIMAATMGNNPKGAKLGPPEGAKLNEKGELLDRWGTPYFFHQLSRDHMEIRSAGPDKVMWTEDDPVIK
jgi:hypothetical protein